MSRQDSSLYPKEICEILGLMLAAGQMNLEISNCFVKPEHVDFVTSCIPPNVLFDTTIWTYEPKIIRVYWKTSSDFPIDPSMLYYSKNTIDKRVPNEVLRLPLEKLQCVLNGFIKGNSLYLNGKHILRITSNKLAANMCEILKALDKPFTKKLKENIRLLQYDADLNSEDITRTITLLEF